MANLYMNEYDFVDEIIRVTKAIKKLYDKLCLLDANGKKNTAEFKQNIEYLKTCLEVEEELYVNCPDYNKCLSLLGYYFRDTDKNTDSIKSMGLFDENEDSLIKKRIQNALFSSISLEDLIDSNIREKMQSIPLEELFDIVRSIVDLFDTISLDIKTIFLQLLHELHTNKFEKLDKELFFVPVYNAIFTDKNLEEILLNNNFELPECIIRNVDTIADYSRFEEDSCNLIKNRYASDVVIKSISYILSVEDVYYFNDKVLAKSLIMTCLLRAGLLFLTDDVIAQIKEGFKEYLDEHHHNTSNYHISEDLINNAFHLFKEDNDKVIKVKRG